MVEVANTLSPPDVEQAPLLFVVAGAIEWKEEHPLPQLLTTQEALREAFMACFSSYLSPEILVTVASNPWAEIVRAACVTPGATILISLCG